MNFYSSSVALLWVTAFRVVAPPSGSRHPGWRPSGSRPASPRSANRLGLPAPPPSVLNNSGFRRKCSRNENYVCACFPDRASDSACQHGQFVKSVQTHDPAVVFNFARVLSKFMLALGVWQEPTVPATPPGNVFRRIFVRASASLRWLAEFLANASPRVLLILTCVFSAVVPAGASDGYDPMDRVRGSSVHAPYRCGDRLRYRYCPGRQRLSLGSDSERAGTLGWVSLPSLHGRPSDSRRPS